MFAFGTCRATELKANNDALARKIGSVIEESSVDRINYLDNSLKATSHS